MNESFPPSNAGGCDAVQQRISEAADSGEPLSADARAHVAACAGCALFAEQWLHGPPAELTAKVTPAVSLSALRERVLDRNAAPNVVPFSTPSPGTVRRVPWSAWVGRIAAGVVVAAFSYWLLDPVATPPTPTRSASADSRPTLGQGLSKLEDQSRAEREAIRTALVGGSRQVQDSARWTLSALEL